MAEGIVIDDIFGQTDELFHLDVILEQNVQQPSHSSTNGINSMDELPLHVGRDRLNSHLQENHLLISEPPHSLLCSPVNLSPQISPEMPLCLLEDDEENEIRKLIDNETTTLSCEVSTVSINQDPLLNNSHKRSTITADHQIHPLPVVKQFSPNVERKEKICHAVSSLTKNRLLEFLHKQQQKQDLQKSAKPVASGLPISSNMTPVSNATVNDRILHSNNHHFNSTKKKSFNKKSSPDPTLKKTLKPPQNPVTDYGAFVRERQSSIVSQCSTSQEVSRKLATTWKLLKKDKKQEYLLKSEIDQLRYVNELKDYIAVVFEGMSDKLSLSNIVDDVIHNTSQNNDSVMECNLCNISFCNMYRKKSHFCGRPHSKQLLLKLMTIIRHKLNNKQGYSDLSHHDSSNFDSLEQLVTNFCTDDIQGQ